MVAGGFIEPPPLKDGCLLDPAATIANWRLDEVE